MGVALKIPDNCVNTTGAWFTLCKHSSAPCHTDAPATQLVEVAGNVQRGCFPADVLSSAFVLVPVDTNRGCGKQATIEVVSETKTI